MTRTIPFAVIILLFSSLFVQTTANAGVSIIATVNGKPITNYDVEQRALFLEAPQLTFPDHGGHKPVGVEAHEGRADRIL